MWGPTKNVGSIGSAVFSGYKQTDTKSKYIEENCNDLLQKKGKLSDYIS